MKTAMIRLAYVLLSGMVLAPCLAAPLTAPSPKDYTQEEADKFNKQAKGVLAPVYPALAEYLTARYALEAKRGIGIDLGSGPGDLILELCKRTKEMYWINADINPFNFKYFFADAERAGMTARVGAVFADAHALPFIDGYADIIVSRGTFQFWEDQPLAFKEIYRVLKPGGVAYIGRGYSENLPPAVAESIRKQQGDGGPAYDVQKTAQELAAIMKADGITGYQIIIPTVKDTEVKYGIWIEIRKPAPDAR